MTCSDICAVASIVINGNIVAVNQFRVNKYDFVVDWKTKKAYRHFMGALKSYKCSKGHVLKDGNLYIRKNGSRECRKCSLARRKAWKSKDITR